MKPIELKKMGLEPLDTDSASQINGGKLWGFYEKIGFVIGVVVGTTLHVTRDLAQSILQHQATR